MSTLKSKSKKDSVLDICTKATLLGNKISVHMLEYLSTVKNHPHGFDTLAHDFLDICRILWSIEAGLNECSRTNQIFPPDMVQELERKFRTTYNDFQSLDQMLFKFLEYEKKGTVGKIQRGWRRMFADNDIEKMRDSLSKTREALRMSALVFQWSLGNAKIDDSIGIGYTGLAAALDRMARGRSVSGIAKVKSLEQGMHQSNITEADELILPALPPLPPVILLERDSVKGLHLGGDSVKGLHLGEEIKPLPELRRHTSISNRTVSSHDMRERVMSTAGSFDRLGGSHVLSGVSSGATTEAETLVQEVDPLDSGPMKVVRLKADPFTMPRWTPRNTAGANAASLKAALIAAVQAGNHKLIEQLLDRGVSPDTGLDSHALNDAVHHHDIESIRLLLLFGADPNTPSKDGTTPLVAALEESFLDGATMLLKYGADPNLASGSEPESPLAMAIFDNKTNFIHLLLTYGGDPNHLMTNGNTVLIGAINRKTSKKLIDLLLDYGSDPNGKNREGKTPLFEAIQLSRVDIVTTLLDHGANPNLPGPKHMLWPSTYQPACLEILLTRGADAKKTPGVMELAASINNIDSVRILLKAGVDPNAKKDGTYTPLCTAIRDNRADIFQLLLANGADPNVMASEYPAFKCVTHFRVHFLPALVQAGADLNNPRGILETAVHMNNTEALLWLLDQGVNPNDKTSKGYTPLTTAIRENRADLVDLLLSRGADPNIRGEDWPVCMAVRQPALLKKLLPAIDDPRAHKGVLEMAVVANQLESIKLLLAAGVSVEDKNGGVFSPLTTAIREDRKDLTKYLLDEGGADPNAPGEHLPIVKAVRRCRGDDLEMIEILLLKGADPNKTYRGWNAIMQAVENGDANVLRLLVEKGGGVDLDARDDAGRTVSEIASGRGWEEAGEILLGNARR
jgi:ankyrin repeat protein